jgi:bifunctional ADP-heptose synthase (sugar kinase/adenylyltransferase)
MCFNVAENVRSIGAAFGKFDVEVLTHRDEIRKERYVDTRRMHHLLRVDHNDSVKDRLSDQDLRYLFQSNEPIAAVVVSDYDKGFVDDNGVDELITRAKASKVTVFVDTKRTDISMYKGCVIKMNESERKAITKFPPKADYELIVTRGDKGALWNGKEYPTNKAVMYDVCGAGDVFIAALTVAYVKTSGNLHRSITFANACATESVKHFGNHVVATDKQYASEEIWLASSLIGRQE